MGFSVELIPCFPQCTEYSHPSVRKFFKVAGRRSHPPMPTPANIVSLVQKCFLNPTPAPGCYNAWMPISAQCVGRRRTSLLHPPATASDLGWIVALGAWNAADSHFAIIRTIVRYSFHRRQQSISENFDRESRPCITRFTIIITSSPAAEVAPAPVAPPPPLPPAEQPPNPATIDYKDGLLSVRAQNPSLVNILVQIQHQTGLVIDGLNHDQRVYGQYGPGSVSTTLSALLDGAGYDFVIVGGVR